jgi:hypothetical protein
MMLPPGNNGAMIGRSDRHQRIVTHDALSNKARDVGRPAMIRNIAHLLKLPAFVDRPQPRRLTYL